ncbi:MAG: hypothetical protein HYV95_04975 [Opitutae bacterium]|nr:hypothetical protein [Opitutae bacterium]
MRSFAIISLGVVILTVAVWFGYRMGRGDAPRAPGVVAQVSPAETKQPETQASARARSGVATPGSGPKESVEQTLPQQILAKHRLAEASFNEIVTRNVALDYGAFFAELNLPDEVRDLALMALGDQFGAATGAEKAEYDELLKKLLGPDGFERLAKYRERLPAEKQVNAGLSALDAAHPGVSADERAAVRTGLAAIPPRNPVALAVVVQPEITDQDIARVRASYEELFNKAFAGVAASPATIAALRAWYLDEQITAQMSVILIQQQMLREKKPAQPSGP